MRSPSVAPSLVLGAVAAYGPIGYPVWLALATRGARDAAPPEPAEWPAISVVIPAYREEDLIAAKVADTAANGYPGVIELLVVADDPATAEAARATPARLVEAAERLGKSEALNRGIAAATHDIVVVTDANTKLGAGAIAHLVRWFEDPQVGAVAGEKQVMGGAQGAYWAFESFLKRRESRRGTTIGLVGELAAFRRALVRPLPEDVVVDDLWMALDVLETGARIVYEGDAVAYEHASVRLGEEWERRTRVVLGVLDVLWRRRRLLVPGASPVAAELWGHRLVRSSFGPLAHLLLVLRAARHPRWPLGRLFVAGHFVAAAAVVADARGARLPGPLRAAAQVVFLQAVGLGGSARYLRGDRPAKWRKAARTGLFDPDQPAADAPGSGITSAPRP